MNASQSPVVLVVDDHADTREMLLLWLGCSGFQGIEAVDAGAALAAVAEAVPDAILLDMGLPDLDGYEVCRRLRQNPATRATPVIALTGYGSPGDLKRARDAGCDVVLVKPCPPDQVVLELQRHLPAFFGPPGS
ncbi:MAG TPA: response regulator [Vicinamibacterales bacterium]|jgi:CheY-like chemotaxis protein